MVKRASKTRHSDYAYCLLFCNICNFFLFCSVNTANFVKRKEENVRKDEMFFYKYVF